MPMTADEMIYRLLLREWIALGMPNFHSHVDVFEWIARKVDLDRRTKEVLGDVSSKDDREVYLASLPEDNVF